MLTAVPYAVLNIEILNALLLQILLLKNSTVFTTGIYIPIDKWRHERRNGLFLLRVILYFAFCRQKFILRSKLTR